MAKNYKQMYENAMMMLGKYQDVIVPGLREQLARRVEVVRCKDCKKYQPETKDWIAHCTFTGIQTNTDDFCSYGERKEE